LNNFSAPSNELYVGDWQAAVSFQEFIIFATLPSAYPSTSQGVLRRGTALSLFLTNNQIETVLPIPGDGSKSSSSLVILANQPVADEMTTSLVISSNKLYNASTDAPTALVVVPNKPQSAVTGNLILNKFELDGFSLHIYPNVWETVWLLTVVGNVFLGGTNIDGLMRPDLPPSQAPFNTWLPFNSTII
jgi:hypothetical protein